MDDVVVIGGSAAGTAAGIYLARRNIEFRVISIDFGGEVLLSGDIQNWPGIPETNGMELTEKFREHLAYYKVAPELDVAVTGIKKNPEGRFIIEAFKNGESVSYDAKAVIIATGSHPRELHVPGEKEFRGKGLSYCTVCDGPLFGKKTVVTIGGGDAASESGIMLNDIAEKAYVITKNPYMKGDPSLISRLHACLKVTLITNGMTKRILGNQFVTGVEYEDVVTKEIKTIEAQGVFVHIGMIPNSGFVPPGVERNQYGEIVVDKNCETSVKGIFAAGDVTDTRFKQIGIAVGQGITAALAAVTYVNKLGA